MTTEIRLGLDVQHRDDLIQLFCDTFPEIIMPVFGSIERCARLLERSLVSDRILTAILGDRLIGFAGLHYSNQEMHWGIFRVVAMGIILFKRPKPDVLHLDTLAVHPDARGQGIGTQLIQAVEALAQSEGKGRVTLEVEDINPRARRLYEQLGFVEDKFEKLPWPWSKAFAFAGSYVMRKDVAAPNRNG
jgi:ribosomal protein S18 acetylase RimI-like enzyme